jgi:hypothetical protein
MTTICLVNQSTVSAKDFATIVNAIEQFVPLVTKAWNLPAVTITTTPTTGAWMVYITEQNRKVGATGYHTDVNGIPTAYCSPAACYRVFGKYYPAFSLRGKVITPARYSEGLATTVAHEIAEMLCDPAIKNLSAVDSKGRNWLIEVCDHVFGVYFPINAFGTNCVMPDVTTPAFYNLNGVAPYSIRNSVSAPFTMTKSGYGYYSLNNTLMKIV